MAQIKRKIVKLDERLSVIECCKFEIKSPFLILAQSYIFLEVTEYIYQILNLPTAY